MEGDGGLGLTHWSRQRRRTVHIALQHHVAGHRTASSTASGSSQAHAHNFCLANRAIDVSYLHAHQERAPIEQVGARHIPVGTGARWEVRWRLWRLGVFNGYHHDQ